MEKAKEEKWKKGVLSEDPHRLSISLVMFLPARQPTTHSRTHSVVQSFVCEVQGQHTHTRARRREEASMSRNWLQLERVTGSSHWHHAKADTSEDLSSPAMIIDAWVDRQRESHSRPTTQEEQLSQRRALCAAESGLVLGSWSGWVGTCNSRRPV